MEMLDRQKLSKRYQGIVETIQTLLTVTQYKLACTTLSKYLQEEFIVKKYKSEFSVMLTKLAFIFNNKAMLLIQNNENQNAQILLTQIVSMLTRYGNEFHNHQISLAYNHLGICLRKEGKLKEARDILKKSLKITLKNRELVLLNLCAICSQMKDHISAEKLAKQAILELTNQIVHMKNSSKQLFKKKVNMLSVSYYNLAVQNEYLKRFN